MDGGGCEGLVPEAGMILDLWADTLLKLQARDFAALAPRLDWVLKLSLLERVLKQRPELGWASPEVKHLDHLYSALNGGLYQTCERAGAVERVVSDAEIQRFVTGPPEDTRAYTRSRLLRLAGPERVEHVDWDEITFRLQGAWPSRLTVPLANPLGFTKQKAGFLETATFEDALDILGARPAPTLASITIAPVRPRLSTALPKPPKPYRP